jgi:hypothetical protein
MSHSGSPERPRLALVVGVGRSGTSACSGALAQLGYAVPQPELKPDESNPRGFGEPQWLVGLQSRVLKRHGISAFDGRPDVWAMLDGVRSGPAAARLRGWLGEQLEEHERIVVKDPRTALLVGVWQAVLADLRVPTVAVTLLRPPGEIIASARRHYGGERWDAARLGGWVNVMLSSELLTRDRPRVFIRYHDLLQNWRAELGRVAVPLGVAEALGDPVRGEAVDAFLEPALRREQETLADLDAPDWLCAIAARLWEALAALALDDTPQTRADLEQLRAEYDARYAQSIAVVHHTIKAAARDARRTASDGPGPST